MIQQIQEKMRGGGAGRGGLCEVFGGPKGAAGLSIPADASQQLISFALCCSLAKLRKSRTSCSQPRPAGHQVRQDQEK